MLTLKSALVTLQTYLKVPLDADRDEIHKLANAVDPSSWKVLGPGYPFPSGEGVKLSWTTVEEVPNSK